MAWKKRQDEAEQCAAAIGARCSDEAEFSQRAMVSSSALGGRRWTRCPVLQTSKAVGNDGEATRQQAGGGVLLTRFDFQIFMKMPLIRNFQITFKSSKEAKKL
jgi:hypothetical protein